MQLTERQLAVVTHPGRHICVRAGPGTGKTTVLTHRIVHLVTSTGVNPGRICAVTFTRSAAAEMKARIESLVPQARGRITVRTFHSLAWLIIRTVTGRQPRVLTRPERLALLSELCRSRDVDPRTALTVISRAKNGLMTPKQIADADPALAAVWKAYEETKPGFDYDDLLIEALRILQADGQPVRKRFSCLLVDELQDVSPVQFELVKVLAPSAEHLFAVGDPLQCIYEWRASSPELMDRFCEVFEPELLDLCENFRSKQRIVELANRVMEKLSPGRPPLLPILSGEGEVRVLVLPGEEEEARVIASEIRSSANPSDCAVLVRLNRQRPLIEQALARAGLSVSGQYSLQDRKEVRLVLDLLRMILDPEEHSRTVLKAASLLDPYLGRQFREELEQIARENNVSLYRALDGTFSRPYLAVGARRVKEIIERLHEQSRSLAPVELLTVLRHDLKLDEALERRMALGGEDAHEVSELLDRLAAQAEGFRHLEEFLAWMERPDQGSVKVMTIHRAKGLEFRKVFVPGLAEGTFPASESPEEWRLLFVAVTRARESLVLSAPGSDTGCRFLELLDADRRGSTERKKTGGIRALLGRAVKKFREVCKCR